MVLKTIVGIICVSTIAFPIYKGYKLRQKMRKCWPAIRCTPLGQLLHPFVGPKNISIIENAESCETGKFSSMFSTSINEHAQNLSKLTSITESINDGLNYTRKKIQLMEKNAYKDVEDLASKIFRAYGRIAQILVVIFGLIKKISTVFKNFLDLAKMSYYTFGSVWNGPIGGTARYFGSL